MTNEQQKHLDELEANGIEQVKKMCENHGLFFGQANMEHRAYDCFITNKVTRKTSICEIKNRYNADNYDTLFMEVDKLNRLLKWKEKFLCWKAFYINVLGTTLYIFEVDEDTLKKYPTAKRWMNSKTYESTDNKTMKEVIELPKSDAKIIYSTK